MEQQEVAVLELGAEFANGWSSSERALGRHHQFCLLAFSFDLEFDAGSIAAIRIPWRAEDAKTRFSTGAVYNLSWSFRLSFPLIAARTSSQLFASDCFTESNRISRFVAKRFQSAQRGFP
jgi:hypothetical protein